MGRSWTGLVLIVLLTPTSCRDRTTWTPVELKARNAEGLTLLHIAARDGHVETAKALIAQGAEIEVRDSFDRTPLHWAAISGQTAMAALLLDHGARIEAPAFYDMRPLHWAALAGQAVTAELLINRGAEIEARNMYGMTPLHEASDPALVKLLLRSGVRPNVIDQRGMTPLHLVYTKGVAQALIDAGADPFAEAFDGTKPVQMSATVGDGKPVVVVYPRAQFVRMSGESARLPVTVRNVTPQAVQDLRLAVDVDLGAVTVEPAVYSQLNPAQMRDFTVTFSRPAGATLEAGVAKFRLTRDAGDLLTHFNLRIDARQRPTPEDKGMIQVAAVSVRPAPAIVQYLAYLAAPILIAAIWLVLRFRRKSAS